MYYNIIIGRHIRVSCRKASRSNVELVVVEATTATAAYEYFTTFEKFAVVIQIVRSLVQ